MNFYLRLITLITFLLISSANYAGGYTLVLIHGYLSDASLWRTRGIVAALQETGWQDAGTLFPSGPFPRALPPPNRQDRYLYTVSLPSEAPLAVQARWLDTYLHEIVARHPDHELILIGHSAGGVVARLVLVTEQFPIMALITIASPHLGTDAAEAGLSLSHSPFSWFAPFFGLGTINRSEDLYWDLIRESPDTPLFWLNRSPHPDVFYLSIIRVAGDEVVEPYSQDMNDIPALRGKVLTIPTVGPHSLHPGDGPLLATWLNRLIEMN